jgi:hypothetical protein
MTIEDRSVDISCRCGSVNSRLTIITAINKCIKIIFINYSLDLGTVKLECVMDSSGSE